MHWTDEGYLLTKKNFNENSIIIDVFTLNHGKSSGIVYGGSSRKIKKNFQIGNKILLNWKSKGENKIGYFSTELLKPISPYFFDNKEKSIVLVSATSLLQILLPERQINKKIYKSFENILFSMSQSSWIEQYILWELSLIKELGFEINFLDQSNIVSINDKNFKIPSFLTSKSKKKTSIPEIKEALLFNKNLIMENFILPNKLSFPLSRNVLEKYYS
tara:strand:+ start:8177 stop:8827 length:651 start_codon:yes stop_codon:yes gene_type:complete